jgi:two-component system, sensor histidine kinase PdtaS
MGESVESMAARAAMAAVTAPMTRGQTAGDLVFEIDAGGVFLQFLGQRGLFSPPPEELLGKSVRDVLVPAFGVVAMHAVELVLRDGMQRIFEYDQPMAGGVGVRRFEARISSASNGNLLAVLRDVDDRRVVEQELHESEARFRLMADHAPVMLWMAGIDSECCFFNQGWLEFAGRPLEKEIGVGWAERVHHEDFQSCMDVYLSSFVAQQSFRMEYRLRRADGQYRWVLDSGVPRYEPDGSFAGYIGSCIDISEIREAREQLERTSEILEARVVERTEELARRVQEREVLVREVHHRVKNNLQLVSSLLSIQGRQLKERHLRQALEECQGRVQTIALIHQRLYQSTDLAHVQFAQYARSLAASVFQASGVSPAAIALEMDLENVSLSVERAIPCGLILNELLTNALKHAFPDGRRGVVRVDIHRTPVDRLQLVVSDDGSGLPPSIHPRDTSSLGLQLVGTLAEQLDADLHIERDHGTSFRLEFDAGT